ncbi:Cytochrome P450 2C8 [Pelobates cultripes]|uniref:Cytochrome P450 2C8 n=1 Tax=Pelobates cultripes TaxID=61616 RepID=A0AAD1T2W1_PELCU|nr:Cytochrome P450 2C8 [Pelobates cultripes]
MDFGVGVTLFLVFCTTCLIYLVTWIRNSKKKGMPPGPTSLPLIGNLLQLNLEELPEQFTQLAKTYGTVFTVHLGTTPAVVLFGYDTIKEALIDNADVFSYRAKFPALELVFKNNGVLLSNGEKWKQLRRFCISTLRNFGMGKKSIEERIQEEAHFLGEEFKKQNGSPFDPSNLLSLAVGNIICSVVFGQRFEYEDQKFLKLLKMMTEILEILNSQMGQLLNTFPKLFYRIPGSHQQMFRMFSKLHDFIMEKVKEHQETLDENNLRDFIDCYLIKMEQEKDNPNTEFNHENLFATISNLFFGGTETTTMTLRHGLRIFLKYPDISRKIQEEIDLVVGLSRSPSVEDRIKMPYTDAVFHEIQRFADIAPLNLPHTVNRTTTFRGHSIPQGTMVFPMLSSALKDPKYFRNPEKFDPGHFLDDNGCFKKSEAFIPFSAGKRICPGEGLAKMEIFLIISSILQKFNLKCNMDPSNIDISPQPGSNGAICRPYQLTFMSR